MKFLNKGIRLSLEQIKSLPDGTKVYVESTFPEDNSFIGIKKANQIFMPDGSWWVLGADFEALCIAYEYDETVIY